MRRGSFRAKTPCRRSSASLSAVTRCDQRRPPRAVPAGLARLAGARPDFHRVDLDRLDLDRVDLNRAGLGVVLLRTFSLPHGDERPLLTDTIPGGGGPFPAPSRCVRD